MRLRRGLRLRAGISQIPDAAGEGASFCGEQVELAGKVAALCKRRSEDLWALRRITYDERHASWG